MSLKITALDLGEWILTPLTIESSQEYVTRVARRAIRKQIVVLR
jgi:hypothetical protein